MERGEIHQVAWHATSSGVTPTKTGALRRLSPSSERRQRPQGTHTRLRVLGSVVIWRTRPLPSNCTWNSAKLLIQ